MISWGNQLTCCLLHVYVVFLERQTGKIACVSQIWSRPPGAEGLQSAVRTARSGQPTDSWLPQMMHRPWHPNWPQCLSQGAWCFWMCAPMCVSPCVFVCSVEYTALDSYSLPVCIWLCVVHICILGLVFECVKTLVFRCVCVLLPLSFWMYTTYSALGWDVLSLTFHLMQNPHRAHTHTHSQRIHVVFLNYVCSM